MCVCVRYVCVCARERERACVRASERASVCDCARVGRLRTRTRTRRPCTRTHAQVLQAELARARDALRESEQARAREQASAQQVNGQLQAELASSRKYGELAEGRCLELPKQHHKAHAAEVNPLTKHVHVLRLRPCARVCVCVPRALV